MHYESPAPALFQWKLDIDLQRDFSSILYRCLLDSGYKDADKEHAVYQYYNLRKRIIARKPRKVIFSKEFICPVEYQVALEEFEAKAARGENLMPFQSEKINNVNYNDMLLNDWGIQHFHLTRRFRPDGFAQRSQFQIFAYITDTAIYMIQIYPHSAEDLYSKRELVRIIRDNWPYLIERFRLNGIVGISEKLDDHKYGEMRNAHICTLLELAESEVYCMIGGGYASNGFSVEALRTGDFVMNKLGKIQFLLRDYASWIGKNINLLTSQNPEQICEMNIQLLWIDKNEKVTIVEKTSSLLLQLDMKKGLLQFCNAYEVLDGNDFRKEINE